MKKKLTIAFISSVLLTLFIGLFINKAEAETINYIYFDLNCGSVTLNVSTYSGCVYQTIDGETTSLTVSGTHNSSNYYYVYQSNDSNKSSTGVINGSTIVPTYASLKSVTDSFINETDVEKVISTWRTEATSAGRTTTGNFIALSGALKANITIDNIWSSFHEYGTGRRNGGISFISSSGSNVTINLKGENRVGNIYYSSSSSNTNTFKITSADGSKKTTGALVVANINSGTNTNYWDSAIGGSDSGGDYSKGIVIDGGTIYAGTNKADNSTAIGGGGNGYGGVTISGGIVTAVSHTTGTAIGGGIGYSSRGGDAYVKITGGTVYAYNYGQNYKTDFVPGVAIGGGSSCLNTGNLETTVEITGGTVYAQSVGGVAIGGGSSTNKNGGDATIIIGGTANVTAKSVEGSFTYDGISYDIAPGSGIGGGTGGVGGNGGSATVTITGGTINSGTIGGGETNNKNGVVGSATIDINDGDITGRIIMHIGSFTMSGGTLSAGTATNGGCVQMYGGDAIVSGGEIKLCSATENGGAIYIGGGTFTLEGGKIYKNSAVNGGGVYLADGSVTISSGSIEENSATTGDGGGIFVGGSGTVTMTGGSILNNTASNGDGGGVYQNSGTYDLQDGTLKNNKATNGGGIYIANGSLTITTGNVQLNEATENGGGIFVGGSGTVTTKGGNIIENTAENGNGGGVYQNSGTYDMQDGTLKNNIAINGGGIYIANGSLIIASGTVQLNNATTGDGGGIFVGGSGTVTMTGGSILNNTASNGDGGGVYQNSGTYDLQDGTLKNNSAINGGGIYLADGSLTMTSGTVQLNNATTGNGGGIFVGGTGSFTMKGGNIINNTSLQGNGGGVYQNNGTYEMLNGSVNDNSATNGGGVYISDGSISIEDGKINSNKATTGNGGGVYIGGNGSFTIKGGSISYNTAESGNGGGVYQNSGIYNMSNGSISYNESINGGGAFVNSATFSLTGGSLSYNTATLNGGGFYIGDNSTVSLTNGNISNNSASNGGGFYQTQTSHETITTLSGDCNVDNNESVNGNGGGVYIDGGSIFRFVGGKIIYNKATASILPDNGTAAKNSSYGVGGGVYILYGTFTMYDENDLAGNAAIFGNVADYAADDLFASGINTSFDAIPVVSMKKDDAYRMADSWFEDFPTGEEHIILDNHVRNDGNNSNDIITSVGRYKNIENIDDKVIASTVLYRNCHDYIAITMGNSIGSLTISIDDANITSNHSFIYKIESCSSEGCSDLNPEIEMEVLLYVGEDVTIVNLPTGTYRIYLIPDWSWRFDENVDFIVTENAVLKDEVLATYVDVNVYTDQTTLVETKYTIEDKKYFSKVFITEYGEGD